MLSKWPNLHYIINSLIGDLIDTKVMSTNPLAFTAGTNVRMYQVVLGPVKFLSSFFHVEAWGRQLATAPLKTRSVAVCVSPCGFSKRAHL